MKKLFIVVLIIICLAGGVWYLNTKNTAKSIDNTVKNDKIKENTSMQTTNDSSSKEDPSQDSKNMSEKSTVSNVSKNAE